ncbi:hypothetical protein CYMTET_47979 [Cymbomonas tetramitiformis]|uniref:1,3-beta-glucan synthase n=1 Tax=Cymbomonas tetramitiformis TaxID=36881 RepID=A0AAE0BT66_9CHLO|nr:hypothetical protein CYMTET_47979 [Cymbomonas tetramitiformis]
MTVIHVTKEAPNAEKNSKESAVPHMGDAAIPMQSTFDLKTYVTDICVRLGKSFGFQICPDKDAEEYTYQEDSSVGNQIAHVCHLLDCIARRIDLADEQESYSVEQSEGVVKVICQPRYPKKGVLKTSKKPSRGAVAPDGYTSPLLHKTDENSSGGITYNIQIPGGAAKAFTLTGNDGKVRREFCYAITQLYAKLFEPYEHFVSRVLRNHEPATNSTTTIEGALRDIGLFMLVWGEAGNVRHLPEFVWFMFHCLRLRVDGDTREPAPPHDFLENTVRPMYQFLLQEVFHKSPEVIENNAKKKCKDADDDCSEVPPTMAQRITYCDANEWFWNGQFCEDLALNRGECDSEYAKLQQTIGRIKDWGNPVEASKLKSVRNEVEGIAVEEEQTVQQTEEDLKLTQGKTWVEHNTWCAVYLAFYRLYSLSFLTMHLLTCLGVKEVKEWNFRDDAFKALTFTVLLSHATLAFLRDLLYLIYQPAPTNSVLLTHMLGASLTFLRMTVMLFCVLSLGLGVGMNLRTMVPAVMGFGPYEVLGAAYIAIGILAELVVFLYQSLVTKTFLWANETQRYWDNRKQVLHYSCFWIVLLVARLAFGYYFEVRPVVEPSVNIYHTLRSRMVEIKDESSYQVQALLNYYLDQLQFLTLVMLWVPIVLMFLVNTFQFFQLGVLVWGSARGVYLNMGLSTSWKELTAKESWVLIQHRIYKKLLTPENRAFALRSVKVQEPPKCKNKTDIEAALEEFLAFAQEDDPISVITEISDEKLVREVYFVREKRMRTIPKRELNDSAGSEEAGGGDGAGATEELETEEMEIVLGSGTFKPMEEGASGPPEESHEILVNSDTWVKHLPVSVVKAAFNIIWDRIIESMREDDLLSDQERDCFSSMKMGQESQEMQLGPKNPEGRRMLMSFLNSLSSPDLKAPPLVRHSRSFTVLTPYYQEDVMYTLKELIHEKPTGVNVSLMSYMKRIFPLEWDSFVERMHRKYSTSEREVYAGLTSADPHPELEMELQMWATKRSQALGRTINGMMQYEEALKLQAEMEGDPDAHVDKFTYVISCQVYPRMKADDRPAMRRKAAALEYMLGKYEGLRMAYIEYIGTSPEDTKKGSNTGGRPPEDPLDQLKGSFYSVLAKGVRQPDGTVQVVPLYRVRLPGPPIMGEGKPENQNHAICFVHSEFLQVIDMNQDGYFLEALKMRNLLNEFTIHEQDENLPNLAIVGMREHIFSAGTSAMASFSASMEFTFGSVFQRMLASPLNVRMHYGHPDVWDTNWCITNGGVSKAMQGLHVSEDIFGGFNATLRGRNIIFREYMIVGKGRDQGFAQINSFETKVSGGNGEQLKSREIYRLGNSLDFFRQLSFCNSSVGVYVSSTFTLWAVRFLIYSFLLLALSDTEHQDQRVNIHLPTWLNLQAIAQLGVLSISLFLVELVMEYGLLPALKEVIGMTIAGALPFFAFVLRTRGHYVDSGLVKGNTKYIPTGRGFALKHEPFVYLYKLYAHSHIYGGAHMIVLLIFFRLITHAPNYYVGATWTLWLVGVSWMVGPFWFNPRAFVWNNVSMTFMGGSPPPPSAFCRRSPQAASPAHSAGAQLSGPPPAHSAGALKPPPGAFCRRSSQAAPLPGAFCRRSSQAASPDLDLLAEGVAVGSDGGKFMWMTFSSKDEDTSWVAWSLKISEDSKLPFSIKMVELIRAIPSLLLCLSAVDSLKFQVMIKTVFFLGASFVFWSWVFLFSAIKHHLLAKRLKRMWRFVVFSGSICGLGVLYVMFKVNIGTPPAQKFCGVHCAGAGYDILKGDPHAKNLDPGIRVRVFNVSSDISYGDNKVTDDHLYRVPDILKMDVLYGTHKNIDPLECSTAIDVQRLFGTPGTMPAKYSGSGVPVYRAGVDPDNYGTVEEYMQLYIDKMLAVDLTLGDPQCSTPNHHANCSNAELASYAFRAATSISDMHKDFLSGQRLHWVDTLTRCALYQMEIQWPDRAKQIQLFRRADLDSSFYKRLANKKDPNGRPRYSGFGLPLPNMTNNLKEEIGAYEDFVGDFGTHFLKSVVFGGQYILRSKFDSGKWAAMAKNSHPTSDGEFDCEGFQCTDLNSCVDFNLFAAVDMDNDLVARCTEEFINVQAGPNKEIYRGGKDVGPHFIQGDNYHSVQRLRLWYQELLQNTSLPIAHEKNHLQPIYAMLDCSVLDCDEGVKEGLDMISTNMEMRKAGVLCMVMQWGCLGGNPFRGDCKNATELEQEWFACWKGLNMSMPAEDSDDFGDIVRSTVPPSHSQLTCGCSDLGGESIDEPSIYYDLNTDRGLNFGLLVLANIFATVFAMQIMSLMGLKKAKPFVMKVHWALDFVIGSVLFTFMHAFSLLNMFDPIHTLLLYNAEFSQHVTRSTVGEGEEYFDRIT